MRVLWNWGEDMIYETAGFSWVLVLHIVFLIHHSVQPDIVWAPIPYQYQYQHWISVESHHTIRSSAPTPQRHESPHAFVLTKSRSPQPPIRLHSQPYSYSPYSPTTPHQYQNISNKWDAEWPHQPIISGKSHAPLHVSDTTNAQLNKRPQLHMQPIMRL
jgi:hypothetical protein